MNPFAVLVLAILGIVLLLWEGAASSPVAPVVVVRYETGTGAGGCLRALAWAAALVLALRLLLNA
ncbi:MAG: hypothetical protein JXA74_07310 [Anaerolineae bacterium]|nr:hypothetical protein [Anaerolineae bacterium]